MPRSRRSFPVRPKRRLAWSTQSTSTTVGTLNAATVAADLLAPLEVDLGHNIYEATVKRILGNLIFSSPASSSPGDSGFVYAAIGLVDEDQANVPDPSGDHYDWMWQAAQPVFVHADQPASFAYPLIGGEMTIDNKSQRRINEMHQKLVLVTETDGGITGTLNVALGVRTLVDLT